MKPRFRVHQIVLAAVVAAIVLMALLGFAKPASAQEPGTVACISENTQKLGSIQKAAEYCQELALASLAVEANIQAARLGNHKTLEDAANVSDALIDGADRCSEKTTKEARETCLKGVELAADHAKKVGNRAWKSVGEQGQINASAYPGYEYRCGTLRCGYVDINTGLEVVMPYGITNYAQPAQNAHRGDRHERRGDRRDGGAMSAAAQQAQRVANFGTRQYTPPAQQPAPQVRTSGGGGVMGNAAAASYAAYRAQQPQ